MLPEVHPLRKLPSLDAREEKQSRDDYYCPLPRDRSMLEDYMIDDGNVECWKDCDEAEDDGPE